MKTVEWTEDKLSVRSLWEISCHRITGTRVYSTIRMVYRRWSEASMLDVIKDNGTYR